MLVLALDTSTRQASVALSSDEKLYGEYSWQVDSNHSVELLDRVQRLFSESGLEMTELDAVVTATGPGSFNGVRVAVSVAKSLAFALQKPLVGICTLDGIAAHQRLYRGPICSLIEAGRGDLYAACYLFDQMLSEDGLLTHQMHRLSDYLLLSPPDLADLLLKQIPAWLALGDGPVPPVLFCGELSRASRAALSSALGDRARFVSPAEAWRHASMLSLLAGSRLREGRLDDPLSLEPLYLRRPSITTSARKQPLLGGTPDRPEGPHRTGREDSALRH